MLRCRDCAGVLTHEVDLLRKKYIAPAQVNSDTKV